VHLSKKSTAVGMQTHPSTSSTARQLDPQHAATIPETRRDAQLTTVGPMSDIVDDKKHIRGTIDLSNAVWQRAAGSEELPGPHLEIAFVQDGYVAMRSSENPVDSETLIFTPSEWEAFVLGAKDGEFDVL
jgi:hypothetical protein